MPITWINGVTFELVSHENGSIRATYGAPVAESTPVERIGMAFCEA